MAGQLYKVSGTGLIVDAGTGATHMSRKLGIDFYNKRNTLVLAALEDGGMKKYQDERTAALKKDMDDTGKEFAESFNAFAGAGFSEEIAKRNAEQHAYNYYLGKKAITDLKYPENITDGLIKKQTEGFITEADIYSTGTKTSKQMKAVKKAKKNGKATK